MVDFWKKKKKKKKWTASLWYGYKVKQSFQYTFFFNLFFYYFFFYIFYHNDPKYADYFKGLDAPGRFAAIFTRETTFVTSCSKHFWKGVYFKRKEFAPIGVDPFQKVAGQTVWTVTSPENRTSPIETCITVDPFDITRKDIFCLAIYYKWKYFVLIGHIFSETISLFCFWFRSQMWTLKLTLRLKLQFL